MGKIKKYNFKVGHFFKIGNAFYEITGIVPMWWTEASGSCTALSTLKKDFEDNLKPSNGYAYWNELIGIDGALNFLLEYPRGTPHWNPHGGRKYLNRYQASYLRMKYFPFLIMNPKYPTIEFYNPEAAAKNADMYFEGERWRVELLEWIPDIYTELTKYEAGGIGEG